MDAAPSVLRNAIDRDERLIWWDRPKRGLTLRAADAFVIPFSIVWASGAATGVYATLTKGAQFPEVLFAGFFAVAGIYILIGRFFQDAWRRGRLVYGLTSKRILIVAPSRQTSLDLASIAEMQLQQQSNGTGSIVFGPDAGLFNALY